MKLLPYAVPAALLSAFFFWTVAPASQQTPPPIEATEVALGDAVTAPIAVQTDTTTPQQRDQLYPFYMPMQNLRAPANVLRIRCDASRAARREVYDGRSGASLYGRAEGGYEFIYEAYDGAGRPCVYPFVPWMPQVAGNTQGTQYIFRSSVPGVPVTFRSDDQWATINLRMFDLGPQRIHFEMRDIALDFPGAVQPSGAIHPEVIGITAPGLFTTVIRRSRIFGGKNAIFMPGGQTMVYIEDSEITGNVGNNADQEHSTYINGTLVTHIRNSSWSGQRGWVDIASGHQLKDKSYLRIYENLTVSNLPNSTTASAMPLIDATAFGFTWSDNLRLNRVRPEQQVRDTLVDLRTAIAYGERETYPWNIMASPNWRMPAEPLTALDQVYLSVFRNTHVASFRTEPYVFALRPQGTGFEPGRTTVAGQDRTTKAQQRTVSLAFNTTGNLQQVYAPGGWTYVDPQLPADARWVTDRDAFIRHALGLIGR